MDNNIHKGREQINYDIGEINRRYRVSMSGAASLPPPPVTHFREEGRRGGDEIIEWGGAKWGHPWHPSMADEIPIPFETYVDRYYIS